MEYFEVERPYEYDYLHLDPQSERRCRICSYPVDRMGWSSSVPASMEGLLFLSRDFRVIAHRDLDTIWEHQAHILPVGPSRYRQILPGSKFRVAEPVECRTSTMCDSGDHFSVRVGCNDVYVRPKEEIAVASGGLPMGSGIEMAFPFLVREDLDELLRNRVPSYASSKVRFDD